MRIDTPLALAVLAAAPALAISQRAHHSILARRATCQPCTCDSDSGSNFVAVSQGKSATSGGRSRANAIAISLPSARPVKQRPVPRVKPSHASVVKGADSAFDNFVNAGVIPPALVPALKNAFNQSLTDNTHHTSAPPEVVDAPGNVVFSTNATANNMSSTAIINIRKAIQDALNAAELAEGNLDASTKAQLSTCLNAILSNGGLPANYSCITATGSTSAGLHDTLNNILEQFLGILPNKILEGVFDAVMPQLTDLLPDEYSLVDNINKAIQSITASASGGSVTALEQLQDCYDKAVTANGNTSAVNCYTSSGAYDTLQSSMNGVIQQFVGVLPANLISSVQNLVAFNLGNKDSSNVTQAVNDAILSVGASLSGSTVTIYEQLEQCASKLLIDGDANAAKDCTTAVNGATGSAATMLDSIAQQFAGYVPSVFFTELSNAAKPFLANASAANKTAITNALQAAFDNSRVGPTYVGCFLEVQRCVVDAITSTGDKNALCAGPVNGCQRMGASGNSVVGSVTMSAAASASSASSSAVGKVQAAGAAAVSTTEKPAPSSAPATTKATEATTASAVAEAKPTSSTAKAPTSASASAARR